MRRRHARTLFFSISTAKVTTTHQRKQFDDIYSYPPTPFSCESLRTVWAHYVLAKTMTMVTAIHPHEFLANRWMLLNTVFSHNCLTIATAIQSREFLGGRCYIINSAVFFFVDKTNTSTTFLERWRHWRWERYDRSEFSKKWENYKKQNARLFFERIKKTLYPTNNYCCEFSKDMRRFRNILREIFAERNWATNCAFS